MRVLLQHGPDGEVEIDADSDDGRAVVALLASALGAIIVRSYDEQATREQAAETVAVALVEAIRRRRL